MTPGGEEPPHKFGDNHEWARLSQEQFEEICDLIKDSELSFKEIANKFSINSSTVVRINQGSIRFQENKVYPLRAENTEEYKKKRALEIIDAL